MKSYHIVSLNSYHIVSLHLKIVHYWIFCICMHLDHAYHVIFQIKIIWIWKMFIHICGMFDLQLTNASRLKHLFNQFYRFIFLEMIFNSCMDIIWFICHIQKKSDGHRHLLCFAFISFYNLHVKLVYCTSYSCLVSTSITVTLYDFRDPWLEIKFEHYLIKHQSQGGLAPGHWICPIFFFLLSMCCPLLPLLSG